MSWSPQHAHVSQIHPDTGSGADDCGPACVTRYLFEAGKLAADLDPWAALAQVAEVIRGVPDSPLTNSTTDDNALIAGLAQYGITGCSWTDSYEACLHAAWSIILVRGPDLAPQPCPLSWWGNPPEGSGDHWMLWLPAWRGAANWFDNPLQYIPGQVDSQFDLTALKGAFYGGVLLPTTNHGETPPPRWTNTRGSSFGLLSRPQHGSTALAVVPARGTGIDWGGRSTDAGGTVWMRGQWRDVVGWAPVAYIKLE